MNFSREDIAWVAGIFEGEGAISKQSNSKGYYVGIAMADRDIVERVAGLFPFGELREEPKPLGRKMIFNWRVTKAEYVQAFIAMVWPWLGERRKAKALEALRSISSMNPNMLNRSTIKKLTMEDADMIRILHSVGQSQASLARDYGVSSAVINQIIRYKTYKEA